MIPIGFNSVGFVDIDVNVQSTHNTNQSTADPHGGGLNLPRGRWVPDWCQPRHRIAIIIPYRNRQQHLRLFISHMRKLLQRQLLDFTIYVIEQVDRGGKTNDG
jgi:hypothetical protein